MSSKLNSHKTGKDSLSLPEALTWREWWEDPPGGFSDKDRVVDLMSRLALVVLPYSLPTQPSAQSGSTEPESCFIASLKR